MTPVIEVSYTKLTNLFKSLRKQNSTSNPSSFVCIGPKYCLGQLNLGGMIAHIILHRNYQVIASGGLFNSENGLRPFVSHCDNQKFTPFG